MSGFIIGVISSISGALIVLLVQLWFVRKQEKKGAFSGYWKDQIFDENENVVKQDLLHFKQKGGTIHGKISRVEPANQRHRKWNFIGRLHGRNFFAIFWPSDKSVLSYGCWYVHQKDDFTFDGFYLKLDEKYNNRVNTVHIEFHRMSEKEYLEQLQKTVIRKKVNQIIPELGN